MADNVRNYYEWLRLRLGIQTPVEAGLDGARVGDAPPWSPDPSNYKLFSAIRNATQIVNQHVGLAGNATPRDIPTTIATTNGPQQIDLASVPGFRDRSVISVRRAWWWDGTNATRLDPVILSSLDSRTDPYLNDAPGTPRRFAVEGYTVYLDPPPSSTGWFRLMATAGVLCPQDETEGFEGIPEAYDPCVLYIALVELGKMTPGGRGNAGACLHVHCRRRRRSGTAVVLV